MANAYIFTSDKKQLKLTYNEKEVQVFRCSIGFMIRSAVLEIKRRRLSWLEHVLRMPKDSIPKVAMRWTSPGKRKRGQPKMT